MLKFFLNRLQNISNTSHLMICQDNQSVSDNWQYVLKFGGFSFFSISVFTNMYLTECHHFIQIKLHVMTSNVLSNHFLNG